MNISFVIIGTVDGSRHKRLSQSWTEFYNGFVNYKGSDNTPRSSFATTIVYTCFLNRLKRLKRRTRAFCTCGEQRIDGLEIRYNHWTRIPKSINVYTGPGTGIDLFWLLVFIRVSVSGWYQSTSHNMQLKLSVATVHCVDVRTRRFCSQCNHVQTTIR